MTERCGLAPKCKDKDDTTPMDDMCCSTTTMIKEQQ
jgi:hypothetical protein